MTADWDTWAARANVLPLGGWRGNNAGNGKAAQGSKATRFQLKAGDTLARGQAPYLVDRPFTVTAKFDTTTDTTGVVIAQGGAQQGFTLFVKDGKLTFLLRVGTTTASVSQPLPAGTHTALATLTKDNTLTLQLDGKTEMTPTPSKLTIHPVDGLEVGRDNKGAVGPYTGPFPFTSKIQSIEITLQ